MSNEGFFSPPFLHPSLSSVCHICGLCGDVSLLRMDSPAQKRPYYIYILLHHSETMPAGLQNFGQREGEKKLKGRRASEKERGRNESWGVKWCKQQANWKKQLSWTARTLVNKRWRRHKILKQADQRSKQGDRTSGWTLWHTENTNNTKLEGNTRKENGHTLSEQWMEQYSFIYLF